MAEVSRSFRRAMSTREITFRENAPEKVASSMPTEIAIQDILKMGPRAVKARLNGVRVMSMSDSGRTICRMVMAS